MTNLEVRQRDSALRDGTQVLVLRNAEPYAVDFSLRCFSHSGTHEDLSITVPASGEKHVGFFQGWSGNFKSGERCEARLDGEVLWTYTVQAP